MEGAKITRIEIVDNGHIIDGTCIRGSLAESIRKGEIREILAYMS